MIGEGSEEVVKKPRRKKKYKRVGPPRPVGKIYLRAAQEMGLSKDAGLFKLIKEVAIKTNTTLDLTEYMIAYYMYFVKHSMKGSNFPRVNMPYFGILQPNIKSVRQTLKMLIQSYKYGKTGRIEFVRLFRYHWLIYRTIMDRTKGKYPIWRTLKKKKLNDYKALIIHNPDRKTLLELAKENPEHFDRMREKIASDKRRNIMTNIDAMKDLLTRLDNKD